MPLNKLSGEFIPDLGPHDAIAPPSKWAGSPWMEIALLHAAERFGEILEPGSEKWRTAMPEVTFDPEDILIQEYHYKGKLLFLFQKEIHGDTYYAHFTADIDPATANALALIGKWKTPSLETFMRTVN